MKTITLTDIIILKNKGASDPAKDQRLRLFTSEFFPHKRVFRSIWDFQSALFLTHYLIGQLQNCIMLYAKLLFIGQLRCDKPLFIGWSIIQQGWMNVTTCSVKKVCKEGVQYYFSCSAAGSHCFDWFSIWNGLANCMHTTDWEQSA